MAISRGFNFSPNTKIKSAEVNSEFNLVVNTLNSVTDNNFTFGSVKTFTQLPKLNSALTPTNSLQFTPKSYVDGLFRNGNRTAAPVYATSTTFTVANISCLDSLNASFMSKTGSTTVNITTTGSNGIASSGALAAGNISITNGSSTVTGTSTTFTTSFVVGDVIRTAGGQGRRITAIASNTSLTVESNFTTTESAVQYFRGGRAPNTHYHLYAIQNPSTLDTQLILSTRNTAGGQTLTDLPASYTTLRQQPFSIRTDASSNIIPFIVGEGWPFRPLILLDLETYAVLVNGSSTSFATVNTGTFVPPTSRIAVIDFGIKPATGIFNSATIRRAGTSSSGISLGIPVNTVAGVVERVTKWVWLDASQQFEYQVSNSSTGLDASIAGFVITEVA